MKKGLYLISLAFLIIYASSMSINTLDYDEQQSKLFQSYCVMTHCSKQLLINWNCKICGKITELQQRIYVQNTITNVVGLVGYNRFSNAIILIFRGTEGTKNWIQDLSYDQVPYPRCKNCKIHAGFYSSFLSVSFQLASAIEKLRQNNPGAKIISTGSSLGAALATIFALETQVLYGNVAELHTFGCPRVGDQNFVQYLKSKVPIIKRVVHNRDIVPHVPLLTQNFVHPSNEIFFDENMENYKICNDSGQDPSCSNSFYPNFSIEDHISYWQKPTTSEIC